MIGVLENTNTSLLNSTNLHSKVYSNIHFGTYLHLPFDLFPGQEILTLRLVSTELSLETLEQNKLNMYSTAKLSFSKLSKFRLKPHGFTN